MQSVCSQSPRVMVQHITLLLKLKLKLCFDYILTDKPNCIFITVHTKFTYLEGKYFSSFNTYLLTHLNHMHLTTQQPSQLDRTQQNKTCIQRCGPITHNQQA